MNFSVAKTKIIYKGDVIAGVIYLVIGLFAVISAYVLYNIYDRLGLYYLAIGLAFFSMYMIGKGIVMIYLYYNRYMFYKNHDVISIEEIRGERRFSRYRVLKKKKNRRRYIYTVVIGVIIAFGGIFHHEKGLIGATCIPIILMGAIEFSIGLMTEFRLGEYLKHLHKLSLLNNK
ncbi:MAG: hypothetical protein V3V14_11925 [Saprospiraceae bacterium]